MVTIRDDYLGEKAYCEGLGYTLAQPRTPEQNEALIALLDCYNIDAIWLDLQETGALEFTYNSDGAVLDQSTVGFTWATGQPTELSSDLCVTLSMLWDDGAGYWGDLDCTLSGHQHQVQVCQA